MFYTFQPELAAIMALIHHLQHTVLLLIILECKSMNIGAWRTIFYHQEHHRHPHYHHHHYHHHMEINSQHSHPIRSSSSNNGGGIRYAAKQRSFNQIYKVIVGNPFVHAKNIYAKTAIYPRTPVWNFKNDVPA